MRRFVYGPTYCQSCGADVGLNAVFCPNCGNHQPGKWDLDGIKSAGLLILLVVVGIIPLFPVVVAVALVFMAIRLANKVFGSNQPVSQNRSLACPCGIQVEEPIEGAFKTTGVICPNCGTVLTG
ncbi:zinc ribbon domain-containing protein [Rubinisphaera italica]|uniref:Zinc-ribbon domain-containing protein n=1 Tax=Rubinisphaera italica TaxID=2527969 RepID=A0A5C5XQN3_9PLAN|nr:zinc ribbon domain-containing protein [Rubinisphaera italica]TWT64385.1 hypothetical protein Pan54_51470 [Rubinisphaera italica]